MKYPVSLTALVLAMFASATHAQSDHAEASARLTKLSIVALDLFPDDGLDPSFTALFNQKAFSKLTFTSGEIPLQNWKTYHQPGHLATMNHDWSDEAVTAHGAVSATGFELSTSLDGRRYYQQVALISSGLDGFTAENADFRLAPGSALVVSGMVDLSAKVDCPAPACSAWANAQIALYPPNGRPATQSAGVSASGQGGYSGPLSVTYYNTRNETVDLRLELQAQVNVSTVVPEPISLALMAGGLATVAAQQRRRRQ